MAEETKYPAIASQFLKGDVPLTDQAGNQIAELEDFWSWAHSNLLANTERGILAEYIVACALGIQKKERVEWDKYDLLSPEGISIEVKSSGHLQTWVQKDLSKLIFGIQPTLGWDSETNQYDTVKKRQADIYVFCVHKHTEQETVNPLDLKQWDFYLLPTQVLDETVGEQKTITLSSLLKIGAVPCAYADLHRKIVVLMDKKESEM